MLTQGYYHFLPSTISRRPIDVLGPGINKTFEISGSIQTGNTTETIVNITITRGTINNDDYFWDEDSKRYCTPIFINTANGNTYHPGNSEAVSFWLDDNNGSATLSESDFSELRSILTKYFGCKTVIFSDPEYIFDLWDYQIETYADLVRVLQAEPFNYPLTIWDDVVYDNYYHVLYGNFNGGISHDSRILAHTDGKLIKASDKLLLNGTYIVSETTGGMQDTYVCLPPSSNGGYYDNVNICYLYGYTTYNLFLTPEFKQWLAYQLGYLPPLTFLKNNDTNIITIQSTDDDKSYYFYKSYTGNRVCLSTDYLGDPDWCGINYLSADETTLKQVKTASIFETYGGYPEVALNPGDTHYFAVHNSNTTIDDYSLGELYYSYAANSTPITYTDSNGTYFTLYSEQNTPINSGEVLVSDSSTLYLLKAGETVSDVLTPQGHRIATMPLKHYSEICNAVRNKLGTTAKIVSSEIPQMIRDITSLSGTYTIEPVIGNYGFRLNDAGYYESTNKSVHNSYALCRLTFTVFKPCEIMFKVINYAESMYDYAVFGDLNATLTSSADISGDSIFMSFQGLSKPDEQTVIYPISSSGTYTIMIKYRKDGSANNGNDSVQFKVGADFQDATSLLAYMGYELVQLPISNNSGSQIVVDYMTINPKGKIVRTANTFINNNAETTIQVLKDSSFSVFKYAGGTFSSAGGDNTVDGPYWNNSSYQIMHFNVNMTNPTTLVIS